VAREDTPVAVNFPLTDAREVPDNDPLKRSWVGWNSTATDDQLWAVNRGLWILGERIAGERFATLSYGGRIQVVAEITGRTQHELDGHWKSALAGTVLRPGDPVHDALKGSPAPRNRNPVSYFDTSNLESLSPAQRASLSVRDRATLVVTWNPDKWNPSSWATKVYPKDVETIAAGGLVRTQWATGARNSGVEPGDRVFFLRQGLQPRGVIGSGTATSRIFPDAHWDAERADGDANYVMIEWDTLVLPEDCLPQAVLVEQINAGGTWSPQGSGWVLPSGVAADLEILWAQHLGSPALLPARSSPRQGWQMDPIRRKQVENAAQDRLMAHYRAQGWTVLDVRYGNPYDAVATKNGQTRWLEAKGTETAGTTVVVSSGEVQWARAHPGECVLGILSDVVFLPNGDIDVASGTFRLLEWSPSDTALSPRSYDFRPPDTKPLP